MSLSTIQPQIDTVLNKITSLSAVAIDTTTSVSQFVQKLLSTPEFFATVATSDGKPQVVVMNFFNYNEICTLVQKTFELIQRQGVIAAGAAKQLDFNVICMGVGTVLTIAGVYKAAQSLTRWDFTADKADRWKAVAWTTVAFVGIGAIAYSGFMTHKVARGLEFIA